MFQLIVERDQPRVMLRPGGHRTWESLSSRQIYRAVHGVARTLQHWGLRKGDRVAILSENRVEWPIADFACLALGIVNVPIYPTLTTEQTAYILKDAGARAIFVSSPEQLDKVLSIRAQTQLEQIIAMDDSASLAALPMRDMMALYAPEPDDKVFRSDFDAEWRAITPEDLATIIYTSGTTGTPKGVMLTHGNLAANLVHSLEVFGLTSDDLAISCLPLSHITARHTDYAMYQYGVPVAYCPDINRLAETMLEVKPTFFVGVPRLYEKVRSQVEHIASSSAVRRRIYEWALSVGREHRAEIMAGRRPSSKEWRLAERTVFRKIAAGFGGHGRVFISGGAPLGRELAEWYADVGIRIFEGYGLTESSPVIALNTPQAYRLGSVGQALPNVECRLAEDGELLVRGPSIFKGYWKRAEETAAAFEGEWFHTGDIAGMDADGFLSITDRKKDLIKTSGGKFIAPQPIENQLKMNPLISQAAVIGDRRKFACVVIAPQFPMLEDWARSHDVGFASRSELVADARTQQLFEDIVAGINKDLAQFETMKRVIVVADEFSIATGELTPTLKLKRRVVERKYRERIDAIYEEAERHPKAVAR